MLGATAFASGLQTIVLCGTQEGILTCYNFV